MPQIKKSWDGAGLDCSGNSDGYVSVTGLSGGDTITINSSISGSGFRAASVVALADLTVKATITADGDYAVPLAGFISYTKAGSASTPTVNLVMK